MKCDCCGRRRRLFESYTSVKTEETQIIHLCVTCTNLLYKMRDFASDCEWEEYALVQQEIEEKKRSFSPLFNKWYEKQFRPKQS